MKRCVKLLRVCYLTLVSLRTAISIDSVNEIGYCKRLAVPPDSSLIYANEGVWFPQYRSQSRDVKDFSCHTLYEELYRPREDENLALKQISYFTRKGNAVKNPKITMMDETDDKGVYTIDQFRPGHGMETIYDIVLKITPSMRIRYLCTNSTDVRKDFDLIYIETRRSVSFVNDVMTAVQFLLKSGLKTTLVKIKQSNCKRPISSLGYDESFFFEDS